MKKQYHPLWWISNFNEHVVAFVIAAFVVTWLIGVFTYRDTLFADISRATNLNQPNVSQLPLVYKIKDWALHITTTKTFENTKSMTFFVVFDPKNVLLLLEKATSPYEYTYAPGMDSMVQITVMTNGTIPENTTVYEIPLNGSVENVTIANAWVLREDDQFETLAIQKQ